MYITAQTSSFSIKRIRPLTLVATKYREYLSVLGSRLFSPTQRDSNTILTWSHTASGMPSRIDAILDRLSAEFRTNPVAFARAAY